MRALTLLEGEFKQRLVANWSDCSEGSRWFLLMDEQFFLNMRSSADTHILKRQALEKLGAEIVDLAQKALKSQSTSACCDASSVSSAGNGIAAWSDRSS